VPAQEQWDHWMRLDTTAQGRECVVPEVNRNFNIGEKGANMEAQTYNKYLSKMMVSSQLPEHYGDLTYLTQPVYEHWITSLIARATSYTGTPTTPEGTRLLPDSLSHIHHLAMANARYEAELVGSISTGTTSRTGSSDTLRSDGPISSSVRRAVQPLRRPGSHSIHR
jgi:hypothetical protein